MDKLFPAFFMLFIIILIIAYFYYLYIAVIDHSHKKYNTIYFLNNRYYNRNHNHRFCPRGCTRDKKCPNGNYCYNCQNENPFCCCYDSQCDKC